MSEHQISSLRPFHQSIVHVLSQVGVITSDHGLTADQELAVIGEVLSHTKLEADYDKVIDAWNAACRRARTWRQGLEILGLLNAQKEAAEAPIRHEDQVAAAHRAKNEIPF